MESSRFGTRTGGLSIRDVACRRTRHRHRRPRRPCDAAGCVVPARRVAWRRTRSSTAHRQATSRLRSGIAEAALLTSRAAPVSPMKPARSSARTLLPSPRPMRRSSGGMFSSTWSRLMATGVTATSGRSSPRRLKHLGPHIVIADHPFIVELRVPRHPGRGGTLLDAAIRERRAWELQLILNVVLRGQIRRFGARARERTWAYVEDADGAMRTDWVRPGYFIPDWILSRPTSLRSTDCVPCRRCQTTSTARVAGSLATMSLRSRTSLRPCSTRIAASLRKRAIGSCTPATGTSAPVRFGTCRSPWAISPSSTRSRRSCRRGTVDICPECGLNRAPGITRRFHDFIECYASRVAEDDRQGIYKLRSSLVHHGQLFDIDRPGPWGALIPREQKQLDTYKDARVVARDAIINWFLDQPEA